MGIVQSLQPNNAPGCRSDGISPNNMPPLLFHNVHGDNIGISQNGTLARRTNSFCQGIVFSDRPVKVSEKICIRLADISTTWSGVLRLGFTSHDPSTLRNGLPKYACPDLTSRPGFWAKAFKEDLVKKNNIIFYYVNSVGDVNYSVNGEDKGVLTQGVDTRGPVWAMIDIYGNTTCVEFVDPRAHLNNSQRCVNDLTSEEAESSMIEGESQLARVKLSDPLPDVKYYNRADLEELNFHRVRGRNVLDTPKFYPNIAVRIPGEFNNAYVFSSRSILPDESIIIEMLHKDDAHTGSMAFGLTSCCPAMLTKDDLPDDAHFLIDRPEYWVVKKDIAHNLNAKDVVAFTVCTNGEVTMTVNGGLPVFQMHVDLTVPLWAFFDMYGSTDRIRCVGALKHWGDRGVPEPRRGIREPNSKPAWYSKAKPSVLRKSQPMPSTSTATSTSYFELSNSPNSMRASVTANASFSAYETLSPGNSLMEPPANWSVECVACCERPVDSVFYSCGHMCMCYNCALEYWKSKEKGCPICRATISDVIRTYKS